MLNKKELREEANKVSKHKEQQKKNEEINKRKEEKERYKRHVEWVVEHYLNKAEEAVVNAVNEGKISCEIEFDSYPEVQHAVIQRLGDVDCKVDSRYEKEYGLVNYNDGAGIGPTGNQVCNTYLKISW